MRNILKWLAPYGFIKIFRSFNSPWKGDYQSWQEASDKCGSYNSDLIFSKVLEATLKVKRNEYPYERDSVLFDNKVYSWPLAFSLMMASSKKEHLNVLDIGGALGSSFFQNRDFLDLNKLTWVVVEQEKLVKLGNDHISDRNLKFAHSVSEAFKQNEINFVLISSTLQYVSEPYSLLKEVLAFNPEYIVLDRLSISDAGRDVITKQTVSSSIYKTSYPCRFFLKENIYSLFRDRYEMLSEFDSYVLNEGVLNYLFCHKDIGALFRLKKNDLS